MISGVDNIINQSHLAGVVKALFPGHDLKTNSRKSAKISNPITGKYLELDIWIPTLQMSFEFQDPYHYTSTWDSHEPLEDVHRKDDMKKESVKHKGETLVIVPCWWDGLNSSLQATISFYRPDLNWSRAHEEKSNRPVPIPLNSKSGYLQSFIPHVEALMLASFPVSMKLDETLSLEIPWWMGEKYDGVRFCWNVTTRKMYTRSGMELHLPPHFFVCFPASFLDGELWLGRGCFQDAQRIVLYIASVSIWAYFRTVVFDDPDPRIQNQPFEVRYSQLLSASTPTHPFLIIAPRMQMTDHLKLENCIKFIIDDSGEGVILRRHASVYDHGRSTSLLKLKATRGDREALVVSDKDADLVLQLPEGVTFLVSKEECMQCMSTMPKKGEVVTFSYENYSRRELPVNPKLLRVRKDVSWEEILADHTLSTPHSQSLSEMSSKHGGFSAGPAQYWSVGRRKNVRLFFEKVAKYKNLDPLQASTWYNMKRSQIREIQGADSIIAAFNGSIVNAILHAFPDVGLDRGRFHQVPKSHWHDIVNRRRYFEQYAHSRGFDPLIAERWYSVQVGDLLTHKGAGAVLYQNSESRNTSFAGTLKEIFPELKFDATKFAKTPTHFLKEKANRRLILERFASSNGFEPLIPSNWYSIPSHIFYTDKAVLAVMRMYEKSVIRMLQDNFPSIHLDTSLFQVHPNKYWLETSNRRKFFEKFARQKRFDPLISSNWSIVRPGQILAKGGAPVLRYYSGDLRAALLHLFPELTAFSS